MAQNLHAPLHIHHVTCAPAGSTAEKSTSVSATFSVIYPVLGADVPLYTPALASNVMHQPSVANRAAGTQKIVLINSEAKDDDDPALKHVVETRLGGEVFNEQTTSANLTTTSIATEEVFFDIKGQRIEGTPTSPGFYLRRQGTTVYKTIIR